MTLANKITIARIISIPLFVIALFEKQLMIAQTIFALSVLTDVIDGALARYRKEQTRLGSFLDPLADKLLLTITFICITILGWMPVWALIVILSRDLLLTLGWGLIYLLTNNSRIEPRPLGKLTTFSQMICALIILLRFDIPQTHAMLYVMTFISCLSFADYLWAGNTRLSESSL